MAACRSHFVDFRTLSESKWIFTLVCVQIQVRVARRSTIDHVQLLFSDLFTMQVFIVGSPVIVLLQDVSSDGRYIGQSLLVWTLPMSTMILIMGPKMVAVHRNRRRGLRDRSKRGSSEGTRVTGLSNSSSVPSTRLPSVQKGDQSRPSAPQTVDGSRVQTVTFE